MRSLLTWVRNRDCIGTVLNYVAKKQETVSIKEITAVDLVQEALEKARDKCESVVRLNHGLRNIRLNYVKRIWSRTDCSRWRNMSLLSREVWKD